MAIELTESFEVVDERFRRRRRSRDSMPVEGLNAIAFSRSSDIS
jgi:hypothetical protein